MRTPVPTMKVVRSGDGGYDGAFVGGEALARRVTSSRVSARGGSLGCASMVSISRRGLIAMAPKRTASFNVVQHRG